MSLINSLEGLTSSRNGRKQWEAITDAELGIYDSISSCEVWTRSQGSGPLSDSHPVKDDEVVQQLLQQPADKLISGGLNVLVFHGWRSGTSGGANAGEQGKAIRAAMSSLGLPLWILSRLFTHSFFLDPLNSRIEHTSIHRKYWQRFRGGLLIWSYNIQKQVTRGLFFCRDELYWDSFKSCLERCHPNSSQPMLCGVLAYIQQVKVSVSYIYTVRDKIDQFLVAVDKSLKVIAKIYENHKPDRDRNIDQLTPIEARIDDLVYYAQEATTAIPYLNDNRGNLYRISDSLTSIQAENEQYRASWLAKAKGDPAAKVPGDPAAQALAVQVDELNGVIKALQTEIKSQVQAADWVFTKIDSLIQNTNLNLNRTDQRRNMEIADSSYTISVESKRDNLSMMTIAAITMIFLPGTFVASFFAMPLLNWSASSGSDVVTSRFWIYWAVTVPLTIATVSLWWFWMVARKGHDEPTSNDAGRGDRKESGLTATPKRVATELLRLRRHTRRDWLNP